MDVAGRDDDVFPGRSGKAASDAQAFLQLLALLDALAQVAHGRARVGAHRRAQLLVVGGRERGQLLRVRGDALDGVQWIAAGTRLERAAQPKGRSFVENFCLPELVDQQIRERRSSRSGGADSEEP